MKRLPIPAAVFFLLAAGCATAPTPFESHQNLEALLQKPEAAQGLSQDLSRSCQAWSQGDPESQARGVKLYDRARNKAHLLDRDLSQLLARSSDIRRAVELACGRAFAVEYLSRLGEGLRSPNELSPLPNTVQPEPANGYIRPEPLDSDIPIEKVKP